MHVKRRVYGGLKGLQYWSFVLLSDSMHPAFVVFCCIDNVLSGFPAINTLIQEDLIKSCL